MYSSNHEQNCGTNCVISKGTQHDRDVVTGKEFSGTIGPEISDYSDGS